MLVFVEVSEYASFFLFKIRPKFSNYDLASYLKLEDSFQYFIVMFFFCSCPYCYLAYVD